MVVRSAAKRHSVRRAHWGWRGLVYLASCIVHHVSCFCIDQCQTGRSSRKLPAVSKHNLWCLVSLECVSGHTPTTSSAHTHTKSFPQSHFPGHYVDLSCSHMDSSRLQTRMPFSGWKQDSKILGGQQWRFCHCCHCPFSVIDVKDLTFWCKLSIFLTFSM